MADENKYNIKIEAGTDFVLPFLWTDDNDNPYDLTGATVTAQLREHSGDPDAFDFICQHNNEGGRIWIVMPNEVTKEIPYSYGVYDVRVNLPSGVVKEPLYGDAKIQDEVTKPLDGEMLYMVGINTYEDLPAVGILNRLYFCYEDRKIYRWNGQNYIATAVGNGIQRIDFVRTAGDGISDTYRFTFDDGTYFDYEVINGGITNIRKIKTEGDDVVGIKDTYQIDYIRGHGTDKFIYAVQSGRLMYPGVQFDLDSGNLMMYTPEWYSGPTFRLDDETGELFMVFS